MNSETFDPPAGGRPRRIPWNPAVSFVEPARGKWRVAHRAIEVVVGPCALDDVAELVLLWSARRGATRTWDSAWCWLDGWTVCSAA